MRRSVVVRDGQFRPRDALRRVEHAEAEPRFEQAFHAAIDVVVRKQAIPNCEGQSAKFGPATQVRSRFHGECRGLFES